MTFESLALHGGAELRSDDVTFDTTQQGLGSNKMYKVTSKIERMARMQKCTRISISGKASEKQFIKLRNHDLPSCW